MTQPVFTDNAKTSILEDISAYVTKIKVIDASVFNSTIHDGDSAAYYKTHESATLSDGINIEIVHITDADTTTNELTVVRQREGSTRYAFSAGAKIGARLTAEILNGVWHGRDWMWSPANEGYASVDLVTYRSDDLDQAASDYSIALGGGSSVLAAAYSGIAIGEESRSYAAQSVAMGRYAWCDTLAVNGVSIGHWAIASGVSDISIGGYATCPGDGTEGNRIAIGLYARAEGDGDIVIGESAQSWSTTFLNSIGIGRDVYIHDTADEGVALGFDIELDKPNSIGIGSHMDNKIGESHRISGLSLIAKDSNEGNHIHYFSGAESVVFGSEVILTSVLNTVLTINIPAGAKFFPSEFGIIATNISAVTLQPRISVGNNTHADAILPLTTLDLDGSGQRKIYTSLASFDGQTSLVLFIDLAAQATNYKIRPYFKGLFVEDE